jgi:hypothetical protein
VQIPLPFLGPLSPQQRFDRDHQLGLDRAQFPEYEQAELQHLDPGSCTRSTCVESNWDRIGLDNGVKVQAWMHPCQVHAYEELGQAGSGRQSKWGIFAGSRNSISMFSKSLELYPTKLFVG